MKDFTVKITKKQIEITIPHRRDLKIDDLLKCYEFYFTPLEIGEEYDILVPYVEDKRLKVASIEEIKNVYLAFHDLELVNDKDEKEKARRMACRL